MRKCIYQNEQNSQKVRYKTGGGRMSAEHKSQRDSINQKTSTYEILAREKSKWSDPRRAEAESQPLLQKLRKSKPRKSMLHGPTWNHQTHVFNNGLSSVYFIIGPKFLKSSFSRYFYHQENLQLQKVIVRITCNIIMWSIKQCLACDNQ